MNTCVLIWPTSGITRKCLPHRREPGLEDVYKRMFDHIFALILARFHYPINDRKYVMMYYLNGINAVVLE